MKYNITKVGQAQNSNACTLLALIVSTHIYDAGVKALNGAKVTADVKEGEKLYRDFLRVHPQAGTGLTLHEACDIASSADLNINFIVNIASINRKNAALPRNTQAVSPEFLNHLENYNQAADAGMKDYAANHITNQIFDVGLDAALIDEVFTLVQAGNNIPERIMDAIKQVNQPTATANVATLIEYPHCLIVSGGHTYALGRDKTGIYYLYDSQSAEIRHSVDKDVLVQIAEDKFKRAGDTIEFVTYNFAPKQGAVARVQKTSQRERHPRFFAVHTANVIAPIKEAQHGNPVITNIIGLFYHAWKEHNDPLLEGFRKWYNQKIIDGGTPPGFIPNEYNALSIDERLLQFEEFLDSNSPALHQALDRIAADETLLLQHTQRPDKLAMHQHGYVHQTEAHHHILASYIKQCVREITLQPSTDLSPPLS